MLEAEQHNEAIDQDCERSAKGVHRIEIEVSHRSTSRTMYRVWSCGEVLAISGDPEFAACRALIAKGVTGTLRTRRRGATADAMMLDIEQGSKLKTHETSRSGPRAGKYQPFEREDDDAE